MAIASLIIATLVAIAVIYREFIHDRLYSPRLEVTFSLEEPISRERLFPQRGDVRIEKHFWQRLRVKNSGRGVARGCEGVLAEVRNCRGKLLTRYEQLSLTWAFFSFERGFKPTDIAPGRVIDLNTLVTMEGIQNALFPTEIRGDPYYHLLMDATLTPAEYLEPGDYWLRIMIYGKNFKPIERGYAVHWDGVNYKGLDMQEMNEPPTDTTEWPWPILENPESSIQAEGN